MATLTLSDMTYDFGQFQEQFKRHAETKGAWRGRLDIMTSSTLSDFTAALGAYMQAQVSRAAEDAFSESAQSDEAIRSNITFQGVRLTRKFPAGIEVELQSPVDVTIPAMSQFSIGGMWFNRDVITLYANTVTTVTLFQGEIRKINLVGLGTERQSFSPPEVDFVVSDSDLIVELNGTIIQKAFNAALWNYRDQEAYADLTLETGRALIHFGTTLFGTVPGPNDQLTITYAVTEGATTNTLTLTGNSVSISDFPTVRGVAVSNPTGGADERPPYEYKDAIAGSFGTYESATTGNQYRSTVLNYAGVVDAVTKAQRDINPGSVHWMNVIRVSALTTSPWTNAQKTQYAKWLETVTMYSPRFLWQDPIPMPRDLTIDVYLYNTANFSQVEMDIRTAVTEFFSPRKGLLGVDFFESDISYLVRRACKGQLSYLVDYSVYPMAVGSPLSPRVEATVHTSGGTLTQMQYAYSVAVTRDNGDIGAPTDWVFPLVIVNNSRVELKWPLVRDATELRIYGRKADELGLMATLPGNTTSWTDDGSISPTGGIPPSANEWPVRYNTLNSLTLRVLPAERQTRMF